MKRITVITLTVYRCTECLQIETIIADIISLPPKTDDTETE